MQYEKYTAEKLQNGNTINYKVYNGTAYHQDTPDRVVEVLDMARQKSYRLRLFYGDAATGQDWHEEYDVLGRIGRSTGPIKIPLLINNTRSRGGPHILDQCIVKIQKGLTTLYRHPNYTAGEIKVITMQNPPPNTDKQIAVIINGEIFARFETLQQAQNYAAFLKGERLSKY